MSALNDFDDFDVAFPQLYRDARALAMRLLGDFGDAEDAAAEALARALVRWRRVGPLPYRTAWVLRVTTNVAIDMLRRRHRTMPPPPADGSDALARDVAERLAVTGMLQRLPARQREVLVLRHVADMTESDAARAMGISTNSARTHLRRGMQTLRATERDGGRP